MNSRSYDLGHCADNCPSLGDNDVVIAKNGKILNTLSWKTKLFFSFGHVYNDLCASIWFSYTLIFFQMQFTGTGAIAGILILLGQVADALATPFVGFQSDRDNKSILCKYGKRKTWHLLGTVLVTASFPFIFNKCFSCENASELSRIIYYGFFIVVFQFGWAAVQVGHVSLICDLSTNSKERVALNAYRQAATVASSICVYTITWVALSRQGDSSLGKEDSGVFTNVVYIVCAIGIVFSILFHIFVSEPESSASSQSPNQSLYGSSDDLIRRNQYRKRVCSISSVYEQTSQSKCNQSTNISHNSSFSSDNPENGPNTCTQEYKWSDWLKLGNFYKVAFMYMVARLFFNLTQVYTPLFLQKTLHLRQTSIAIIPLVTYISGFIWSFASKYISVKTGPKILLLLGCIIGIGSCIWNNFGSIDNESFKQWQVYGAALLFGMGGTTMLIASLALTSDLIGANTTSSAFVFGTMSFFDKVLNGIVVVVLEQIKPNRELIPEPFYKQIVVYVSGATAILTALGILTIIRTKFGTSKQQITETTDKSSIEEVRY